MRKELVLLFLLVIPFSLGINCRRKYRCANEKRSTCLAACAETRQSASRKITVGSDHECEGTSDDEHLVKTNECGCVRVYANDCPPGVFQAAGEWNPTASIDNLNAYLFSSTLHKGPTLTLTGETTENRTDKGVQLSLVVRLYDGAATRNCFVIYRDSSNTQSQHFVCTLGHSDGRGKINWKYDTMYIARFQILSRNMSSKTWVQKVQPLKCQSNSCPTSKPNFPAPPAPDTVIFALHAKHSNKIDVLTKWKQGRSEAPIIQAVLVLFVLDRSTNSMHFLPSIEINANKTSHILTALDINKVYCVYVTVIIDPNLSHNPHNTSRIFCFVYRNQTMEQWDQSHRHQTTMSTTSKVTMTTKVIVTTTDITVSQPRNTYVHWAWVIGLPIIGSVLIFVLTVLILWRVYKRVTSSHQEDQQRIVSNSGNDISNRCTSSPEPLHEEIESSQSWCQVTERHNSFAHHIHPSELQQKGSGDNENSQCCNSKPKVLVVYSQKVTVAGRHIVYKLRQHMGVEAISSDFNNLEVCSNIAHWVDERLRWADFVIFLWERHLAEEWKLRIAPVNNLIIGHVEGLYTRDQERASQKCLVLTMSPGDKQYVPGVMARQEYFLWEGDGEAEERLLYVLHSQQQYLLPPVTDFG
ncbi:uncharacterized protein LOC134196171 isoform X2 [Corticium candelabrum]|uniref:uncharacterized protein LOC134196171 isoform X2 n=1 Tax=Corticium candelabrum TaxID=121492 RepID=UPI002E25E6E9|nr:uncharacterized protein LOC134196171 isoform X2 [Corticium candelabrum]